MRKKIDTNLDKNEEDLKFEILTDKHDFIIYEALIHRRPA